jgi:hypothetical protein
METAYTPNTEKIEETATPAAPVSKTLATITVSSQKLIQGQ